MLLLLVQLGLQSSRVQLGLHKLGVGLASSGLGRVQLGLLLSGFLSHPCSIQLGCLQYSSVQLGPLGCLSQVGIGVVQLGCLHCLVVQLGTVWGVFLGFYWLILGLD